MADQFKKKGAPKKKARDEFNEDEIFQAPEITREPMSRQARLGSKVVIRITATARPLPSYQWYHNGKKIVGATTDRLTLSKCRRQAAGAYHCEVKNFVGKATSRVAMLSFFTQRIPKLVVGPEVSKLEEGRPFTLKVVSPPAAELKDFKIYWIFNGMRIKGAHGPELHISAAKKKYEGEYKAMIATGGNLETSNVAKLLLKPAKAAAASEPAAAPEEALAQEPTKGLDSPAKPAENWADFLFNPEEEEASLVAPTPGSDEYGKTSPGTPGDSKAPLTQLATQDLIREVAAQGGASELLREVSKEDPSSLILGAGAPEAPVEDPSDLISGPVTPQAPAVEQEDPSGLIESLGKHEPQAASPVQEDPSGLIEALERREEKTRPVAVPAEDQDDLIQDWGIAPAKWQTAEAASAHAKTKLTAAPARAPIPIRPASSDAKPAPSPKLAQKKEFLEKLLGRFQQPAKKAA